jgi:predicted MPP superfamily phosphohydrolase
MIKLQIVSDIHIEFIKSPSKKWRDIITPNAPYLCILGDLCPLDEKNRIRKFLKCVCPHFKRVFYVFGNHEFFSENRRKIVTGLSDNFKSWVSEHVPNLTILDENCVELDGFIIVGATLWTFIPRKYARKAVDSRNDFRSIMVKNNRWLTVKDMNRMHKKSVNYIKKCILAARDAMLPVIVLTHHAPLHNGTSDSEYEIDNTASTDLSSLFYPNVKLWAYGHTHYQCDFLFNETRVYSNPRGYDEDPCRNVYNPEKVIEVF